jgi:replicative DNA helicase
LAAIELELIAAMLQVGDLSVIHKGQFRAEHCLTNEGKALHHFLAGYRYITEGQGSVPTRNIILQRFNHLELPPAPLNPDFDALVHEVHVEATRAQLREFAVEVAALAEVVDPMAELSMARTRLDEIMTEVSQEQDYGFDTHLDLILEQYADGMLLPHGLPWPWPTLTRATKGMQKGDFIILSGRPKTRKTFIGLYVAVHTFLMGGRVLVFTPEMHPYMILLRAAAMAARLRYSEFKMGELDPIEEMSLLETVEQYGRLDTDRFIRTAVNGDEAGAEDPRNTDDRPFAGSLFKVVKSTNRPVSFMHSKIKQYKPHFVLSDSFYLQAAEGTKQSDSDHKVLTGVSRALKGLAADTEIVLMGTHQINRKGDKQIGDLSHLAYADAFGQDADAVLRAITNKRDDGPDLTALAVLGAREINVDGVLINNVPCSDFSEVAAITQMSKLMEMLQKEEADSEEETNGGAQTPWNGKQRRPAEEMRKKKLKLADLAKKTGENMRKVSDGTFKIVSNDPPEEEDSE